MRNSVTIKYYRVSQWGTEREFVHPEHAGDAGIIRALTGQKTINGQVRELIRDLTRGAVNFVETIAPGQGGAS